ncbi:MAG: XRE family transcriptional regulator [Cytophagales bacterium]|nr:MAG: XRE family transcriptional regulator [Cytophagales bacterium]
MKLKIGTKLCSIRDERRLNQAEMADLMGISPSTYARIERNESSPSIEELAKYAFALDVPLHEFLPDTVSVKNSNNSGQAGAGILFGNLYYYANNDELTKDLSNEIKLLKSENSSYKEQNILLLRQIELLEELLKK